MKTASVDLSTSLGPIQLPSPLVAASGTVGSVVEFSEVTDFSLYGAAVAKSVSGAPWRGRPAPRIAPAGRSPEDELAAAVAAAAEADVAIVVVGTTEAIESEGFDRSDLALPGAQDELVRRVAAANPRTVVVVNAGAPVVLPWRDEVAAILLTWFGGMAVGSAVWGWVATHHSIPTSLTIAAGYTLVLGAVAAAVGVAAARV